MTDNAPSPDHPHDADSERLARWEEQERAAAAASRDIADVPAVEVITTAAVHLMSAAAVKTGLADDPETQTDLDNEREYRDLDDQTAELRADVIREEWQIARARAERAEAEVERLRRIGSEWTSNYESWVSATRAAERERDALIERVRALADRVEGRMMATAKPEEIRAALDGGEPDA